MDVRNFIRFSLVLLFGLYQNVSAVVFELDNSNFDETVNGGSMVMVMFYAPWCGACKKALPVLSDVSARYEHHNDVIFARVNGFEQRILALRFDIDAFPTILNFPYQTEAVKYKGRVLTDELRQAVRAEVLKNEELIKTGKKVRGATPERPKLQPKMQKNIKDITIDYFKETALDETKHAMVSVYAPGCTDGCYVFAQVAESFANEDSIVFVSLDFTTDTRITASFSIITNPTFFWFPTSNKEGSRYGGGFDANEIVEFINDETGLAREIGGQLMPNAGRTPELDNLIRQSMNDILTNSRMDGILAQARHIAEISKYEEKYSKVYIDILERIQEGEDVEDIIRHKFDLINNKMEHASTKKENEELIKQRNIVGVFVDIAADMYSESTVKEDRQNQGVVDLPPGSFKVLDHHDEL
ncbi:uncharacterized protein LOC135495381 [Lineus longissimus]|uniref:uncharacterized protein LOC135495381 n=1 Tax=Lineus longissimus TaxID=88925 RepID=UPI002B4F82B9